MYLGDPESSLEELECNLVENEEVSQIITEQRKRRNPKTKGDLPGRRHRLGRNVKNG